MMPTTFKSPIPIKIMKRKTTEIPLMNSAATMLRDFLEDYSLSQAKLAADLHISPQLLNDILASRRLLTPEHCLKLGRYFGNEPEYWMRLQNHYLFRKTQREKADELTAVIPLQAAS
jgi:addiction module HigA family antidote